MKHWQSSQEKPGGEGEGVLQQHCLINLFLLLFGEQENAGDPEQTNNACSSQAGKEPVKRVVSVAQLRLPLGERGAGLWQSGAKGSRGAARTSPRAG